MRFLPSLAIRSALLLGPAALAADQVLMDFEKPRDLNAWEVKSGSALALSGKPVLGGAQSLQVSLDARFSTTLLPRDWSNFSTLTLSYFHELKTPVALTLAIGDLSWLDSKSLWNQHNQTFLLQPGKGLITIPVREMYRGQGEQKFLDLKTNLDPASIVWMEMEIRGGSGLVYLDDLRLSGEGVPSTVAPSPPTLVMVAPPSPAAEAAPAPSQPAQAGEKILVDFENIRDLGMWEQRTGAKAMEMVKAHATHREQSLRVGMGSLIITESISADWSGHAEFAFDVFVEGEGGASVELMIGDNAWIGHQVYFNRHNSIHKLAPGPNTIRMRLADLYRGESGRRNITIKRNIDLDQIAAVSLNFTGRADWVYLDHLRLAGPAAPVAAAGAPAPSPAPTPGMAAAAAGTPASGDLVWMGFESAQELAQWEVRAGPQPERVAEHRTQGAMCAKVFPSNLLALESLPRDWSPYETLAFDVVNPGTSLAKVELLIGDDAWFSAQNYWNRHNSIYALAPGTNTLEISLANLYRGEASARNRGDVKRNIDLNQIAFLSLTFLGKPASGPLYLDHFRLAGRGLAVVAPASSTTAPATGPSPAAPAPRPALPGPTTAAPKAQVFFSFENLQEVVKWEVRTGKEPELSPEHATLGAHSLKVTGGTLLATFDVPRDWSPYQELLIDVFNPADRIRKIELLVGDDAWLSNQNYWNRHNSIWSVAPGHNTLRVGIQGMYRGESGARNRGDVKRNIDSNSIGFMSLNYLGEGVLFLDHLRLSSGEEDPDPLPPARSALPPPSSGPPGSSPPPVNAATPPAHSPPRVWGFDFGPPDQAVWPGFRDVSWNTVYDPAAGYGLERAQARASHAGDTGWPTRLLQDYVWIEKGEFWVDLPEGEYEVGVYFEESGYWAEEQTRFTTRAIIAEGVQVVTEDRRAAGPMGDALHLFQDLEPGPGVDWLALAFEKLYSPRTFTVTVADGQLNLGFYEDARLSTRVAAVVITRAHDPEAARWRQELGARNLREARTRMAAMPLPAPTGYEAFAETARVLVFDPGGEATPGVTQVPKPAQIRDRLSASAAQGETVALRFAVHARDGLARLSVACTDLRSAEHRIASSNIVARVARYYARRDVGDPVYAVVPWFLTDAQDVSLAPGTTRLFWLNVQVPASTPAGEYEGTVSVKAEGWSLDLPARIRVLPFALDPVDVAITLFGMPRDSLEFLAGYGLTSASGGPRIEVHGWDKEKNPQFLLRAANEYIQAARRVGMTREILDYGGPISITGLRPEDAARYFQYIGGLGGLDAPAAAQRVFARLAEFARENQWGEFCLNLVDEPLNRDQVDHLLRSIDFLKAAAPSLRLGGFYSFNLAGDALGAERLFHKLDVTVTKGYTDRVMKVVRETGKKLYLYSLGRSRYTFGPALYQHRRNGVSGYVEWHCSIIHGYQFFDLDGREPDASLILYCREGIRPTLDLERIRQGIFDLRYLITLENRASRARSEGRVAAAERGEAFLASVLGRLAPSHRAPPADLNLDHLREEAAALIQGM